MTPHALRLDAIADRITDTAVSLHCLARTLDIRDGLDGWPRAEARV